MNEPAEPEDYRLFVAVTLPEDLLTRIQEVQTLLKRAAPRALVRWTTRDQWHLTLKFLGDVRFDRCSELRDALRLTCTMFPPLRLTAGGVGFFPNPHAPRVIWVGVSDESGALPGLQQAIDKALQPFSNEGPEQRFQAHVTLGRVKNIRPAERANVIRIASGRASIGLGAWTAPQVELFRSQLTEHGPRYTKLESAVLSASPQG